MATEKVVSAAKSNVDMLKEEMQRLAQLQKEMNAAYREQLQNIHLEALARKKDNKPLFYEAKAQRMLAVENHQKLSEEVKKQTQLVKDLSKKAQTTQNSHESKPQPMQSKPIVPAPQTPKKQVAASQPKFSFTQFLSNIAGAFSKLIANLKLPTIMKQRLPLAMATSKIGNEVNKPNIRATSEKSHLGLESKETKSDAAVDEAISRTKADIEKSNETFNALYSSVISDDEAEKELQALVAGSDDRELTAEEAAEIDSWKESDSNNGDGFDDRTQRIMDEVKQEIAEEGTNRRGKSFGHSDSLLSNVSKLEKDSVDLLDNASEDMGKAFEELESKLNVIEGSQTRFGKR